MLCFKVGDAWLTVCSVGAIMAPGESDAADGNDSRERCEEKDDTWMAVWHYCAYYDQGLERA